MARYLAVQRDRSLGTQIPWISFTLPTSGNIRPQNISPASSYRAGYSVLAYPTAGGRTIPLWALVGTGSSALSYVSGSQTYWVGVVRASVSNTAPQSTWALYFLRLNQAQWTLGNVDSAQSYAFQSLGAASIPIINFTNRSQFPSGWDARAPRQYTATPPGPPNPNPNPTPPPPEPNPNPPTTPPNTGPLPTIIANLVTQVVNAFNSAVAKVNAKITAVLNTNLGAHITAMTGAINALKDRISDWADDAAEAIENGVQSALQAVNDRVVPIVNSIKQANATINTRLNTLINGLTGNFTALATKIGQAIGKALEKIKDISITVTNKLSGAINLDLTQLIAAVKGIGTTLTTQVTRLINGMGNAIRLVGQAVSNAIAPIVKKIGDTLAAVLTKIGNLGVNLGGIWDGLSNLLVPALADWFRLLATPEYDTWIEKSLHFVGLMPDSENWIPEPVNYE